MTERETKGVVNLHGRAGYKPNMAALARSQVAAARQRLGLTPAEFAEVLKPLLGWAPSPGVVENWESTATPPGDVLIAAGVITQAAPLTPGPGLENDLLHELLGKRFADVEAVFETRSEFMAQMPPHQLFEGARHIDAAGLSLNLICQQYPDDRLRQLVRDGMELRCLFLAPYGASIALREREEGYPPGHLSALTEMNIQILAQRVRQRLDNDGQCRVQLGTYDETIRFNILLVDHELAIVQPYLPGERGVESPTFLLQKHASGAGLFPAFQQAFTWLWERSAHA